MKFTSSRLILCLASCFCISGAMASNPFYKDRERGWFWHESQPVEEEKKEEPQQIAPQKAEPEKIELTVEWVKDELPKAMNRAINNPTDENLAAYAYLQRLALDQASRFSSRMSEFMAMESQLDESKRRPTSAMGLSSFHEERREVVREAIEEVRNKTNGIFFFYASYCSYCHRMVPVLNEIKKTHGIDILAISMDGGIIPGMENFTVVEDIDNSVTDLFGVSITPTLHLVMKDNSSELIVEGLKTVPDVEDRILFAARKKGVLSQEMYAKTRSVREINVFKNENGNLVGDKSKLENDPAYLVEMLRLQLEDKEVFGTRRIKRQ